MHLLTPGDTSLRLLLILSPTALSQQPDPRLQPHCARDGLKHPQPKCWRSEESAEPVDALRFLGMTWHKPSLFILSAPLQLKLKKN